MKKIFMAAILLGLLGMILVFHWNVAEVEANDSMKINERKYFTSYVVEKDDTLWDIAERFSTSEYSSIHCYIKEVMESNHLECPEIREGQLLILPYYADEPILDL
ncbi:LysM peptidoglycan-binding domain-containing protein [Frisingicoccus sp.]|uniref:LysM peptidoglycan-binding domain-containing protein n=1 Tax=Frisingicoccus sp. TaxID=1918627 RepID=UPI003AB558FA